MINFDNPQHISKIEPKSHTRIIASSDINGLTRAAETLKSGGLVAFPTETVYGLGANALDPQAADKIYAVKGRPRDNPLIIHLQNPDDAEKYCIISKLYCKLARLFMPGPLTVVLPKRDCIPYQVTGGLETVAVRVPSDKTAQTFIELAGVPVAAPSANKSGRPSPTSAAHVLHDFDGEIEYIIDGGECDVGVESTIIKLDNDIITVLRPGGITPAQLEESGAKVLLSDSITEHYNGTPEAPGMKYRHYAPEAPLFLFDGSEKAILEFLKNKKDFGILCSDEDIELLKLPNALSLGPRGDGAEQAKRLFACLRKFKDVNSIYARIPSKDGIGLAVYNRLVKAAGYEIIKL